MEAKFGLACENCPPGSITPTNLLRLSACSDFSAQAIQKVLWNEEHGAWFDYDLINNVQRPYFVPTNLSPLYFGCYNATNNTELASKVLTYISANGIDAFPGGVPNTLVKSGEQWDFPNAWAPTQYLLSEGLRVLNDERATKLANKWTTRWVRSNYIAYNETGYMFEKVYKRITIE